MRSVFGRGAVCGALCLVAGVASGDGATPDGRVVAAPPDPAVCVSELPLATRAGQVLLVLVDDPADAASALADVQVAGLAPFGSIDDGERGRLAALLADDHSALGTLLAADEEGGRVQRFGEQFGRLPSAATQAATMTPADVEELYADYGASLAGAGVDVVFAPVVDVGGGPAIGDRSYGSDAAVVTEYARAVIAGYRRAGLLPVLKHFPGHGRASADTHDGAATTPPLAELRATDLVPFVELLADDVGVMVGHLDVPGLTAGEPASLSSAAITGVLRDELGFDGLVISDALGMGAITTIVSGPAAVVRFLAAGGDLAIVDLVDADAGRDAVLAAIADGTLAVDRLDDAVARVLAAKGVTVRCEPSAPVTWTTQVRTGAAGAILAVATLGKPGR